MFDTCYPLKWSKIRHKKAANDAVRGQQFSLVAREMIAAIRQYRPPTAGRAALQLAPGELAPGATDPEVNQRLAAAVAKARELNFPKAKMAATMAKAGGKKSANLHSPTYEFFGPSPSAGGKGVAILVECMTDNVSRTNARVKEAVNKFHARFTKTAHFFSRVGYVRVLCHADEGKDFDALFEAAIEAGADDVQQLDADDLDSETAEALGENPPPGKYAAEVLCQPGDLHRVMSTISQAGFTVVGYDREHRATGGKFYQALDLPDDATAEERAEQKDLQAGIEQDPEFLGWYDPEAMEKLEKLYTFLESEADAAGVWSNLDNWPAK